MNRRRMMMKNSDIKTLLLMHGNLLTDQSGNGGAITAYGVSATSSGGKFNIGRLTFNSGYIKLTSYELTITKKWTVDFWVKITGATTRIVLVTNYTSSKTGGNMLATTTSFPYGWLIGTPNVSDDAFLEYIVSDDWVHIAYTFDGTKYTLFYNGSKILESTVIDSRLNYLTIGASILNMTSGWYLKGYISELRISDGVRWTTDFTPPTAPYTN